MGRTRRHPCHSVPNLLPLRVSHPITTVIVDVLTNKIDRCLSARRRRAHGLQPYRGTGWIPGAHGPAVYNPNYQGPPPQQPYYASSPPTYTPQAGGYYGQQNQGYFGGQQTGVELQQPSNAYRGGDNVYEPPTGPPPSKK